MTESRRGYRLSAEERQRLSSIVGLSPLVSDVLDQFACDSVVPGAVLARRTPPIAPTVVGHAITLSYLPERIVPSRISDSPSGLAHDAAFDLATSGDVLVIDASGDIDVSVLGGQGAVAAVNAGIRGLVVDGSVRDVEELALSGLEVWSAGVTPRTGRWRLGSAQIGIPIACNGVHVATGDLVVADGSGVCFIPEGLVAEVILQVWELVDLEGKRPEE